MIKLLAMLIASIGLMLAPKYGDFTPKPRPTRTFVLSIPDKLPVKTLPPDGEFPKMLTN